MRDERVPDGSAGHAAPGERPRRVAILAGQLVLGGAERQLYLWLSHMDRTRFEPSVITLHPDCGDYWEPRIEALGIPVFRVSQNVGRIGRVARLSRLLARERPELIHGWHLFVSPYAGLVAKLVGARASLGSLRASDEHYRSQRVLALVTPTLVDGLVVNSGWAAARLAQRYGGLRDKLHVVRNAVEAPEESRSRVRARAAQRWRVPGDRLWIGSAGRFDSGKRLDALIDAFGRLRSRGTDAHLILMGDGRERDALNARVSALALSDRVTFTGVEPDARSHMGALDIFGFTSMDEGFPNVVLEASAAGVPVVGWRTAFLEEALVHDESALMVGPGDLDALSAALECLARDPGRRQRIGDRARADVLDRFSVRRLVDDMTAVYDGLLGVAARARSTT